MDIAEAPIGEPSDLAPPRHVNELLLLLVDAMFRLSVARAARRQFTRAYASPASPHALVLLEHRQGVLDSACLSALTAATQLGGQVTGLVISGPDSAAAVVDNAKKYAQHHPIQPHLTPLVPD